MHFLYTKTRKKTENLLDLNENKKMKKEMLSLFKLKKQNPAAVDKTHTQNSWSFFATNYPNK